MSREFSFEPGKEIFRWGPMPMKYLYACTFFQVFQKEPLKEYGFFWSDALLLMHKGRFVFLQDAELLRDSGGRVFREFTMTDTYDRLKKKAAQAIAALDRYYNQITPEILRGMNKEEFISKANTYNQLCIDFEKPTIAAELGNYGSIPILEKELRKIMPDEDSVQNAIVILTSSEKPSFYQQEELDLLRAPDLDAHREKYFWLKNSYDHAENLQVSFFEERRKSLDVDLNKKYVKRTLMVKKQKTELENKYQIPKDVLHIASRILDAMEFQDDRKKEILITIHYKDLFLQEFRKRGITHPERYALNELSMILDGKHQENRLEDTGFILKDGVLHEINSQASIRYWDLYANEKTSNEVREFRGTVASKGEVLRGVVRVILDPESPSAQQFQYGEILVSPMTSPEYVFLMKKSAAIVTDTGGLTSHAAIVSRELGVPCIVGTKIATQVLQNRDLVEVDANAGIVRILERGESTQS